MGVDITHIVRNNFDDLCSRESSLKFALSTIQLLKRNLYLDDSLDSFNLYCDQEYDGEIKFRIPLYGVEFTLHKKCWQIESYYHYCQIVMHTGEFFWLREMIYDIAKALGNDEMWHSEEYFTWNGGPMEDVNCSFDEWLSFTREKIGCEIPEYNYKNIIKQGDVHIPKYKPVYHDNFYECKIKFDNLEKELYYSGYKPIGLLCRAGYIRCLRLSDMSVHFLDVNTFQPLILGRPEAYYFDYPSTLFVVKQNYKYALFDIIGGKQLTEYVAQPFRKQWDKELNDYIVINDEIGRYYSLRQGILNSGLIS